MAGPSGIPGLTLTAEGALRIDRDGRLVLGACDPACWCDDPDDPPPPPPPECVPNDPGACPRPSFNGPSVLYWRASGAIRWRRVVNGDVVIEARGQSESSGGGAILFTGFCSCEAAFGTNTPFPIAFNGDESVTVYRQDGTIAQIDTPGSADGNARVFVRVPGCNTPGDAGAWSMAVAHGGLSPSGGGGTIFPHSAQASGSSSQGAGGGSLPCGGGVTASASATLGPGFAFGTIIGIISGSCEEGGDPEGISYGGVVSFSWAMGPIMDPDAPPGTVHCPPDLPPPPDPTPYFPVFPPPPIDDPDIIDPPPPPPGGGCPPGCFVFDGEGGGGSTVPAFVGEILVPALGRFVSWCYFVYLVEVGYLGGLGQIGGEGGEPPPPPPGCAERGTTGCGYTISLLCPGGGTPYVVTVPCGFTGQIPQAVLDAACPPDIVPGLAVSPTPPAAASAPAPPALSPAVRRLIEWQESMVVCRTCGDGWGG